MYTKGKKKEEFARNLIFGIQDSFGSTLGFLSGVAVSGVDRKILLFTGVVLILVEAISMGVGSLISQHTVDEVEAKKSLPLFRSLSGSITMFISYAISGFIPLAPYILFYGPYSLPISVLVTLITLVIVGYISGKMLKINPWHHAKEMLLVGIIAVTVGIAIGKFFPTV